MTDLKALRAIAEAATPGEWKAEGPRVCDGNCGEPFAYKDGSGTYTEYHGGCLTVALAELGDETSDARHIAAFNPAQAIALLDRVELLERLLGEACTEWHRLADHRHSLLRHVEATAESEDILHDAQEQIASVGTDMDRIAAIRKEAGIE